MQFYSVKRACSVILYFVFDFLERQESSVRWENGILTVLFVSLTPWAPKKIWRLVGFWRWFLLHFQDFDSQSILNSFKKDFCKAPFSQGKREGPYFVNKFTKLQLLRSQDWSILPARGSGKVEINKFKCLICLLFFPPHKQSFVDWEITRS